MNSRGSGIRIPQKVGVLTIEHYANTKRANAPITDFAPLRLPFKAATFPHMLLLTSVFNKAAVALDDLHVALFEACLAANERVFGVHRRAVGPPCILGHAAVFARTVTDVGFEEQLRCANSCCKSGMSHADKRASNEGEITLHLLYHRAEFEARFHQSWKRICIRHL